MRSGPSQGAVPRAWSHRRATPELPRQRSTRDRRLRPILGRSGTRTPDTERERSRSFPRTSREIPGSSRTTRRTSTATYDIGPAASSRKAGGTRRRSTTSSATTIVIDATRVYTVSASGLLVACAKTGCNDSPTTLASGPAGTTGVTVDDTNVYRTGGGDHEGTARGAALRSPSLRGWIGSDGGRGVSCLAMMSI